MTKASGDTPVAGKTFGVRAPSTIGWLLVILTSWLFFIFWLCFWLLEFVFVLELFIVPDRLVFMSEVTTTCGDGEGSLLSSFADTFEVKVSSRQAIVKTKSFFTPRAL